MCFAPQRRALFRHRNFQKWSENGVLCTFLLRNVLRATTACTFSTSQLPKMLRDPGVLYLFTSKSASRHNGVQLFISHLPRCLRTRRFSEPTFRPSGATKHRKNTVFCDFPTFSLTCIFFLLIFPLPTFLPSDSAPVWLFAPLLFHLSILSEVWLRNFLLWLMMVNHNLVGGWPTPLKNMSSSVGMMTFLIYGKIKAMFQTTNQIGIQLTKMVEI